MARANMMQPKQNSTYQLEGRTKTVLAAVVLAVASLIGTNLTAGTDATVITAPAFTVSVPELATMRVPKKRLNVSSHRQVPSQVPRLQLVSCA